MKLNATAALFPVYAIAFWVLPVVAVYAANMYGVFPLALGAVTLALSVALLKKGVGKILDHSLALWLGGLLLLGFCSLAWAIDPDHGIGKLMKAGFIYLSGLALYSGVTLVPDGKREILGKGAVVVFGFATLVCAVELFLKYPLYRIIKDTPPEARLPKSIFNHATVMLALMLWGLAPYLWQKGLKYLFAAAWALLLAVIVFLGESQTASAALVIGAGIFCVARLAPQACHRLLAFLVPAGILLAPWIAHILFDQFRALSLGDGWGVYGMRLEIWDAVARHIFASPFYGYGIEAAKHIQDFGFTGDYYLKHEILHPHNNILQFWLEFGFIGAVFLATFLAFVLQRLRRLQGIDYASAMGLFAACLTVAAVGYGFWQTWWAGLLFLSAALFRTTARGRDAARP